MKRIHLGIIAAVVLCAASVFAAQANRHPNIASAHQHVQQAIEALNAAQKAHEYDLGGHAAKAKELLAQAEVEIAQASAAAH